MLDGLVMAGGADIDPAGYGAQPHPETLDTVPERDRFEIALLRAAIERELPVLGICRGMQLINVAYGGTLLQHLPERFGHTNICACQAPSTVPTTTSSWSRDRLPHALPERPTTPPSPTTIRAWTGRGRAFKSAVPRRWTVCAEAIEMPGRRFVLGVQWHPEADETSRVVGALVARGHAASDASSAS